MHESAQADRRTNFCNSVALPRPLPGVQLLQTDLGLRKPPRIWIMASFLCAACGTFTLLVLLLRQVHLDPASYPTIDSAGRSAEVRVDIRFSRTGPHRSAAARHGNSWPGQVPGEVFL